MQNSIRKALSIRIGLVILCVSVCIGVISLAFTVRLTEKEFKKSIEKQTKHLSDTFTQQLWLFDLNATQELSNLALHSSEIRGLRLLNHDKKLIVEHGSFHDESAVHINRELRHGGETLVGYIELSFLNTS